MFQNGRGSVAFIAFGGESQGTDRRIEPDRADRFGMLRRPAERKQSAVALNSKIEVIKRSACGYRNKDNFRTAILFHCGKLNLMPEMEGDSEILDFSNAVNHFSA